AERAVLDREAIDRAHPERALAALTLRAVAAGREELLRSRTASAPCAARAAGAHRTRAGSAAADIHRVAIGAKVPRFGQAFGKTSAVVIAQLAAWLAPRASAEHIAAWITERLRLRNGGIGRARERQIEPDEEKQRAWTGHQPDRDRSAARAC